MTANQAGWNRPQPLSSLSQVNAFLMGKLNHVVAMPAVCLIILYQPETLQPSDKRENVKDVPTWRVSITLDNLRGIANIYSPGFSPT